MRRLYFRNNFVRLLYTRIVRKPILHGIKQSINNSKLGFSKANEFVVKKFLIRFFFSSVRDDKLFGFNRICPYFSSSVLRIYILYTNL